MVDAGKEWLNRSGDSDHGKRRSKKAENTTPMWLSCSCVAPAGASVLVPKGGGPTPRIYGKRDRRDILPKLDPPRCPHIIPSAMPQPETAKPFVGVF